MTDAAMPWETPTTIQGTAGKICHSSRYGCSVCKDTGVELYDKTENGLTYTYARDCTACGGKAVKEKDAQERIERSGIPDRFRRDCTMSSFKTDVYTTVAGEPIDMSKKMATLESFVKRYYDWEHEGRGLYIYSKTKGSGKTFLASCLCNSLIMQYAVNVRFVSCADLIDMSKDDSIEGLIKARVLVLDDFAQRVTANGWLNDILFKIIDGRHQANRMTIYTSNVSVDSLPYDERTVDRIRDTTLMLTLPEVAVRGKNSRDNLNNFLDRMGLR